MESKKYNMEMSTEKTKLMATAKETMWYRLDAGDETNEQVMPFKYLRIITTSGTDFILEVRDQVPKLNPVSVYVRDVT